MPARLHHEVVQELEIVLVSGDQHTAGANRMREVKRIGFSGSPGINRSLHVMPGLGQKASEQRGSSIIVQVKPHGDKSLPRSSGESSFGEGCNL